MRRPKTTTTRYRKLPRGDWRASHYFDATPPYRKERIVVQCPKCRQWVGLKGYEVTDGGEIVPKFKCPRCEHTSNYRLEGFKR